MAEAPAVGRIKIFDNNDQVTRCRGKIKPVLNPGYIITKNLANSRRPWLLI